MRIWVPVLFIEYIHKIYTCYSYVEYGSVFVSNVTCTVLHVHGESGVFQWSKVVLQVSHI